MSNTPRTCHCGRAEDGDVEGLPYGGRLYHHANEPCVSRGPATPWSSRDIVGLRKALDGLNLRAETKVALYDIAGDLETAYRDGLEAQAAARNTRAPSVDAEAERDELRLVAKLRGEERDSLRAALAKVESVIAAARVVIAYNSEHDETCAAIEEEPLACDCGIPAFATALAALREVKGPSKLDANSDGEVGS